MLVVTGCGESQGTSKLYPVKGKVLLADGKPLTTGRVVFVSTKPSITSVANIESDGGFGFKAASGDGLPEAEYKVRIEAGTAGVTKGRAENYKAAFLLRQNTLRRFVGIEGNRHDRREQE